MVEYTLMHKNMECGSLRYDENSGRILSYCDFGNGFSPYLGNSDSQKICKWWEMRAIPASRSAMKEIIHKEGFRINNSMYLAKNLALSLTDTYWIRQKDISLTFDQVKLINSSTYHGVHTPYDPNASLGGQMDKYWDLNHDMPVLVKESYKYFGQQSINEVFATKLHQLQQTYIPFLEYKARRTEDYGILSKCKAFTTGDVEFVSAYEVIMSQKRRNDEAEYDQFIRICVSGGIDKDEMQAFMDYQTMTDFIISNTDEHLQNFGILRDANTMTLLGTAPIFDSGNSMFFDEMRKTPYSNVELLQQKVSGFYSQQEQFLKKVKNKNLVKIDLLPSKNDVKAFYAEAGLPEWKADVISKNYESKIKMFEEFQQGKKISLYVEKSKRQAVKAETNVG